MSATGKTKRVWLGMLLAFVFSGIGLLYSDWKAGVGMIALQIVAGVVLGDEYYMAAAPFFIMASVGLAYKICRDKNRAAGSASDY